MTRSISVLLALLACACHGGARLRSERTIPDRVAHLQALDRMPSRIERVPVEASGVRATIALDERGRFDASRRYVMVHGILSDSRVWRYVAADLGSDADVLLVDLPGCGGSVGPDPRVTGDGPYSPDGMAELVLEALAKDPTTRPGDARPITLVGHSLGGAVVLRMLGDPRFSARYAGVLRRVDSAVLLCPLDVGLISKSAGLERIATLSGLEVSVGSTLGLLQKETVKSVVDASNSPDGPVQEEASRVDEVLLSPPKRRAGQAMIRSAVPWTCDGRPDWAAIDRLDGFYSNVRVPCLLVWGRHDETLDEATGHRIRDRLPRAWLRTVPTGTHALPIEDAPTCLVYLREFPASLGVGWPAVGAASGFGCSMRGTRQ